MSREDRCNGPHPGQTPARAVRLWPALELAWLLFPPCGPQTGPRRPPLSPPLPGPLRSAQPSCCVCVCVFVFISGTENGWRPLALGGPQLEPGGHSRPGQPGSGRQMALPGTDPGTCGVVSFPSKCPLERGTGWGTGRGRGMSQAHPSPSPFLSPEGSRPPHPPVGEGQAQEERTPGSRWATAGRGSWRPG